jgi:hypothetical protein
MTDQPADPFSTGLVYEDQLPLHWQVVAVRPDTVHGLPLHENNADVLRSLSILEEHPQEIAEDHPAVAHELRRLDFKLNLLLDMVGLLVARDLALPERVPLRLTAHGLEWSTRQPPALGSLVQLDIYLSTKLPRPLVLHGRIQRLASAAGGWSQVVAEFEDLSELEADWLEKIIFVHHRRQVAHARRAPH